MYVRLELENEQTDLHQTWQAYFLRPGREYRNVKTLERCAVFESR
jgi:hypothetical protein